MAVGLQAKNQPVAVDGFINSTDPRKSCVDQSSCAKAKCCQFFLLRIYPAVVVQLIVSKEQVDHSQHGSWVAVGLQAKNQPVAVDGFINSTDPRKSCVDQSSCAKAKCCQFFLLRIYPAVVVQLIVSKEQVDHSQHGSWVAV